MVPWLLRLCAQGALSDTASWSIALVRDRACGGVHGFWSGRCGSMADWFGPQTDCDEGRGGTGPRIRQMAAVEEGASALELPVAELFVEVSVTHAIRSWGDCVVCRGLRGAHLQWQAGNMVEAALMVLQRTLERCKAVCLARVFLLRRLRRRCYSPARASTSMARGESGT